MNTLLNLNVEDCAIELKGIAGAASQQNSLLTQLVDILHQTELQRTADNEKISGHIKSLIDIYAREKAREAEREEVERKEAERQQAERKEAERAADAARMMADARESVRNGGLSLSVAFFMQSPSLWPSWKSFWEACAGDPRINATMVLTPACYPDRELGWLDETRAFLMQQGIGFVAADAYALERFRPHVAVLQLPYTDSLPPHLSLSRLEAADVRTVYIPYGLETGGGGLNYRYQYDLPAQRTAWRIFARSERQKQMYAKYCRSGSGHVVVTGHPKLDLSVRGYSDAPVDAALADRIAGRKTLFWNPHFSVQDPPAWSTFDLFKDDILDVFARYPDLFFILRPHPLLLPGLIRSGFWTADDEAALRTRIAGMENCVLDERPDYQTAFTLSDVILTDAGSFLLEFYATGKPVLLLQNPAGYGLNDDADALEGIYKAQSIQDIVGFLDMIRADRDPKAAERKQAIPHFFHKLDGHTGERIRDHIYDAFTRDTARSPTDAAAAAQETPASRHEHLDGPQLETVGASLERLLAQLAPVSSALHIGCADGRLTQIASRHARLIHGIDADQALVARARDNAASWSDGGKASFSVEHFDGIQSCGVYDLVICLDVFSSILSNYSVLRYVDVMIAMMRDGAHLIVSDQLTQQQAHERPEEGRTLWCRNERQYAMMFKRRGLTLADTLVETPAEGCARYYYLFRKEPA